MSLLDKAAVDMAAEKSVIVTPEMTVGHVAPGMPAVLRHAHDDSAYGNCGGIGHPILPANGLCQHRNDGQYPPSGGNAGRPHRARHRACSLDRRQERHIRCRGLGRRSQGR